MQPPTLAEVCQRALHLPCSPALLPKLITVISDPDSTADDVAQLVMLDAALASATLRLASSAYFAAESRPATLAEAVVRLGQRELFRLATRAMISRWEAGAGGAGEPGDFSRHALCTALAAEALAEATAGVDPQTAYTAGLLCDLGKLAVAHSCRTHLPLVRARCLKAGFSWSAAEREVLGYTQSEVTVALLRGWQFPEQLALAAEFCEHPAAAPEPVRPLVAHVHAAKYVATSFGPGVTEEGFKFEIDFAFLAVRGFTPDLLDRTMVLVSDRARARLGDRLSHGAVA